MNESTSYEATGWRLGRPPRLVVLRMIGVCRSRQQHAKYIESKIFEIVFQFP